jgi:hypothetical protein
MALSDFFLSPLGLLALLSVVPLVVLYLVRPDPLEVELPTLRFLTERTRQETTNPILEQLRRNLLLLLQVLVLVLLATSLATPYITVSESETVEETVLVVDASASMGVQTDGTTRFDRAVAAAREEVTGTTSVVVVGASPRVALRGGTPDEARGVLADLDRTDAPGDLRGGLEQAAAVAGESARIVVLSDFAATDNWESAVDTARARDLLVQLRQFDGGGDANVGIVDRSFAGGEVTVSVKNFGESEVTRQLRLGNQVRSLTLAPGDVVATTFEVPAGGGEVRLSPGDSFPTDDAVPVVAPEDPTVDVLLLTNDRNRYLATAISVVDEATLTVKNPPTAVDERYDVVIYSNVDPDELLPGNVAAGRETLERGGGVAVQAQPSMPQQYGDLSLLQPDGLRQGETARAVVETDLTRGIDFQPPDEYLGGTLREGRPLVTVNDGDPLLATAERGPGRILFYGYIEESSAFKFNYQYPVFWKRALFHLAGRQSLPALNAATGDRLPASPNATVRTPAGETVSPPVTLDRTGVWTVDGERLGAALLSEPESNVAAPDVEAGDGGVRARTEERQVPDPVTEYTALGALVLLVGELGFLAYRGDL